jgi:transcriptional regulator with XRE-family HTH domain
MQPPAFMTSLTPEAFRLLIPAAFASGALPSCGGLPGLGEGMRQGRQVLGLSELQAAAKAGVTPEAWRSWEAESGYPRTQELARIVRVLGADGEYDLWRRWRRTPRRMLARLLEEQMQGAAGDGGSVTSPERAAALRLPWILRRCLRRWCRRHGRGGATVADVALALREARTLPGVEREFWIREVVPAW